MSMTIILAPNYRDGNAYAREHGFTLRDSRVITPLTDHGRGLTATDLHIVGAPQFKPGQLDCLAPAFMHSEEAFTKYKLGIGTLAARRAIGNVLNL